MGDLEIFDILKTFTVIRLRTASGTYKDARLEGEPRGALLNDGDTLSL